MAWAQARAWLGLAALYLLIFTISTGFSIGGAYLLPTGALILATVLGLALGSGIRRL
jgi:hypothetical protein